MKEKIIFNHCFLILLVFAFTGCEKGIDATVVEVDEEVIHLSSFKRQYQKYMDNNYQSDNLLTRYSFLNKLVDEKLILKYARENNLDNELHYSNFEINYKFLNYLISNKCTKIRTNTVSKLILTFM